MIIKYFLTIGNAVCLIVFEPDGERNYRALISDGEEPPNLEMIGAIAKSIESVFR